MTKTVRIFLALSAFFMLSFTVAACGGDDDSNDIPSNAVASVDGTPVTKAEYERWVGIMARSNGAPVVPDPPSYARCVAGIQEQARRVRGQRVPSDSAARAQCRQLDEQVRNQVMATLIQAIWFEDEAEELGIRVTDAEVQRRLDEAKRAQFPRRGDYERFLRSSGMTEEDLLFQMRLQELPARITEKIQREAGDVTQADITEYYNRNREQFAVPERRDLEIVLTRTEAQAEEAKRAIEGGMRWAEAARRFSTDALSRGNGGRLLGVARGQQDRALDTAAFNARVDTIVGPVRGQFGWYIVRVTRVTPARQNSLEDSREAIRAQLEQTKGQAELTRFGREFQERWSEKTNCRTGYVIPQICGNAPRPRTTSTAGGEVVPSREDR
ncbi:peptidyl-prolyl cis-trans isomerase [Conexibacter arvalis]|uniref:Foldase protein PrsA n=1 Tax=Conexibacter arvalis TaxID=912552 RepID=A0A840IBM8_9ACTN|nr:foldase protein PrsA [Conexibacter arvalis]